jgi:type IV pilus assembly protein PilE
MPPLSRTTRLRAAGFTLIELMMVVVIIGILAAIGYPSYSQYVMKSRRADAQRAVTDLANKLERYYLDKSGTTGATYTTDMTKLGYTAATNVKAGDYYQLKVEAGGCGDITSCFKVTATAVGNQAKDSTCSTLTLDSLGTKGPKPECWK